MIPTAAATASGQIVAPNPISNGEKHQRTEKKQTGGIPMDFTTQAVAKIPAGKKQWNQRPAGQREAPLVLHIAVSVEKSITQGPFGSVLGARGIEVPVVLWPAQNHRQPANDPR